LLTDFPEISLKGVKCVYQQTIRLDYGADLDHVVDHVVDPGIFKGISKIVG